MTQRGDILKFSEEGIDRLSASGVTPPEIQRRKEKLVKMRLEYRGICRVSPDCITVKTNSGKGYYQAYHESFLEEVPNDLLPVH